MANKDQLLRQARLIEESFTAVGRWTAGMSWNADAWERHAGRAHEMQWNRA